MIFFPSEQNIKIIKCELQKTFKNKLDEKDKNTGKQTKANRKIKENF